MLRHVLATPALAAVLAAPLAAQQSQQQAPRSSFELSVANIMRGPELYGREPDDVRWSPDGRYIYFNWLEAGTDWRETPKPYRVRAVAGARPERVPREQVDTIGPLLASGSETPDGRWRAVSYRGDLYLVETRSGRVRRLTATFENETSPTFAADARTVYFVRSDNVYSVGVDDGLVRQLTDVRPGPAPRTDSARAGQRGLLERQQRELLGAVRDRLRADSIAKAEQAWRDSMRVKPLYLQRGERVSGLSVSPSGRALLIVMQSPAGDSARQTGVPQFVTSSGYTEEVRVRTKVGDAEGTGRVALMKLPAGDVTWLRQLPDTARASSTGYVNVYGWNQQGTHALMAVTSRDFERRYLYAVSDTGAMTTVVLQQDSAWVGSGGGGGNQPCTSCAGWMRDGRRVWYVDEDPSFAHLYTAGLDGSGRQQLTSGDWEVLGVELSRDGRAFFLQTSEVSPFEVHFYRMAATGGTRERITTVTGAHYATPSPDERQLAVVHSQANKPPELFVMPFRRGGAMAQLTTSTTAEFRSHPWIKPAIVRIPASDGVQVPARIYRPQDVGAQPNGAAVIFVHGAGYLHNVHDYWSTYSREYMFNHLLASRGYIVLDVDYRGSAGYGRDWRTAIYRYMGGRDLQDHVDASKWLQSQHGIAPERIGIYGGSYGGFITLMALFNEPQHFGAGAALRSVTDWAHYNHGYTARILNEPQTDTLAYRRSSPIYFAEGLQDPLLIAHGMVDVNVHFQDVVRLAQRLIELGKTDWEMAVYPVEDHAFVRPDSWTDEYRRILELFEEELHEGVPSRATGGR